MSDAGLQFDRVVDVARPLQLDGGETGRSTRTSDVTASMASTFDELMLSAPVVAGVRRAGFRRPSPVQVNAVPVGKLGLDLVVQAKSGTGKTLVFVLLALEAVDVSVHAVQVLIVAPTREIANQIVQTFAAVATGQHFKRLRYRSFIGGTPPRADMDYLRAHACHVVVGTPGRLRQLATMPSALELGACRLLVLDEADKLMDDAFQPDVNVLFSSTPSCGKQVAVFSATYPRRLDAFLAGYMQSPTMVRAVDADGGVALVGVKQYVCMCANEPPPPAESGCHKDFVSPAKLRSLLAILQRVGYSQAMVFCRTQIIAADVSEWLQSQCIDSAFISGGRGQAERTQIMKQLRQYDCKLLISTDLTARGIDAPNVDLVVNFCLPPDTATYFHRIGRAGRFGSYGAAITLANVKDIARLSRMNARDELTQLKSLDCKRAPFDLCTSESLHGRCPPCEVAPAAQAHAHANGHWPPPSRHCDADAPHKDELSRRARESDCECLTRLGRIYRLLDERTGRIECTSIDPRHNTYGRDEMLQHREYIERYVAAHGDIAALVHIDTDVAEEREEPNVFEGCATPRARQRRFDELLAAMRLDGTPRPAVPMIDVGGTPTGGGGDPFAPIDSLDFWADTGAGCSYPAVNLDEMPAPLSELPTADTIDSTGKQGEGATIVFYGSPAKPAGGDAAINTYETPKAAPQPSFDGGDSPAVNDESRRRSKADAKKKAKATKCYSAYYFRKVLKGRSPDDWWQLGNELYDTSEPPFVPHFRQRATRSVLIARWRRGEIEIPDFSWPFFNKDAIPDRPAPGATLVDGENAVDPEAGAPGALPEVADVKLDAGFMKALDEDAARFAKGAGAGASLSRPPMRAAECSISDSAIMSATQVCAMLDRNATLRRLTEDMLHLGIAPALQQAPAGAQQQPAAPEAAAAADDYAVPPALVYDGPPGMCAHRYSRPTMVALWTHAAAHGRAEAVWARRVLSPHGIYVRRAFRTRHDAADCDTCQYDAERAGSLM